MADALGQKGVVEDLINETSKAARQLYCYSAFLVMSELYKQMNMY